MSAQLAYSIHLGSDKNRTTKAKGIAKSNPSGATSFSNNAIQSKAGLSKANKHNLRDYDRKAHEIEIVFGTNNLYKDVQNLYLQEFEQSRLEYNAKQTREDRKINNYFDHISDSKLWDLACEFIIELGDMDYWNDKDMNYRLKMVDVYKEQVEDLMKVVPQFKVANAVIHFDETSPHMHLIGLPISDNNKRGMKKQVAKSKIFTKESLTRIQDEMRKKCIKSFNKFYEQTAELKTKQKGRNQDINVKDMSGYKELKKQLEKNEQRLAKANKQTEKLDNSSKNINEILDNLKPTVMNKNNSQISNENIENIKDYIKDVTDVAQTVRSVNDLNVTIEKVEKNYKDLEDERDKLYYSNKEKDETIADLKEELEFKTEKISKLESVLDKVKAELSGFKDFWRRLIRRFQTKVFDEEFENIPEENRSYTIVAEDLERSEIFDDNDSDIVHNPRRKVLTNGELAEIQAKKEKHKNDYNLN